MRRISWLGVLAVALVAAGCSTKNNAGFILVADGGGLGGAGGSGGAGGTGGEAPMDLCDNAADRAAIEGSETSLREIGTACATPCLDDFGNPEAFSACISSCIQESVDVSDECASCFGDVAVCGATPQGDVLACFACQSDSCDPECLECLNDKSCLTDLDVCTGVPAEPCT